MKSLILTSILAFATSLTVFGQNYIYKGDNQYKATNRWVFEMNAHYFTGKPSFTVAKHANGGYLMIAIDVPFSFHYIGGTVTVFLSDGSTIKCTDKGIRDHVDNQSVVLYNFTKSEIELLKSNRIIKVRFSIMDGMGDVRTYTASNIKMNLMLSNSNQKNYYETDVEITELFE